MGMFSCDFAGFRVIITPSVLCMKKFTFPVKIIRFLFVHVSCSRRGLTKVVSCSSSLSGRIKSRLGFFPVSGKTSTSFSWNWLIKIFMQSKFELIITSRFIWPLDFKAWFFDFSQVFEFTRHF